MQLIKFTIVLFLYLTFLSKNSYTQNNRDTLIINNKPIIILVIDTVNQNTISVINGYPFFTDSNGQIIDSANTAEFEMGFNNGIELRKNAGICRASAIDFIDMAISNHCKKVWFRNVIIRLPNQQRIPIVDFNVYLE